MINGSPFPLVEEGGDSMNPAVAPQVGVAEEHVSVCRLTSDSPKEGVRYGRNKRLLPFVVVAQRGS